MTPLVLTHFTATSCIGRGLRETLGTLQERRTGLAPCRFETVELDTYVGEYQLSPEFSALKAQIWQHVEEEVRKHVAPVE